MKSKLEDDEGGFAAWLFGLLLFSLICGTLELRHKFAAAEPHKAAQVHLKPKIRRTYRADATSFHISIQPNAVIQKGLQP